MPSPAAAASNDSGSPLRHRPFLFMLCVAAGAFSGFSLLLPVVPLWVVRHGADSVVAGAATGVFMASTVLAQFAVPAFVRAFGYRSGLVLGALLIGVPAPFLAAFPAAPAVLAISFVRGLGFGLLTVCGSALIAELLPAALVARGSGLYGLAVGLPQLVGLPAGTAVVEHWGFGPVFALATALPLSAVVPAFGVPRSRPGDDTTRGGLRGVKDVAVATWRPWLPMLALSTGYGALATFLPIVLSPTVATIALLVVPGAAMLTRWLAGHYGDRVAAPGRMLLPALAVGGGGLLGFALVSEADGLTVVAVVAVAVFGVGFGVVQNDALVAMFARAPAAEASVAWNIAFDAGQGLGAVAVGALISATTVGVSFTLLAIAASAVLPVVRRVGRRTGPGG